MRPTQKNRGAGCAVRPRLRALSKRSSPASVRARQFSPPAPYVRLSSVLPAETSKNQGRFAAALVFSRVGPAQCRAVLRLALEGRPFKTRIRNVPAHRVLVRNAGFGKIVQKISFHNCTSFKGIYSLPPLNWVASRSPFPWDTLIICRHIA